MIIDGRTVPHGSVLQADVCVIGGGPAGISLALRLSGRGHRIIVLEGGDLTPDVALQSFFDGESAGAPILSLDDPLALDELRVRVLGGATRHWGGYERPLVGIELEDRPCQPVGGWPLWADELTSTWYHEAHPLLQVGPDDFEASSWLTRLGLSDPIPTGPDVELAIVQKRYLDFGVAYRSQLQAATDLDVLLRTQVTSLSASADAGAVAAVEAATLEGPSFRVEASAVVLAAGGIENARLLLASNDVVTTGLGNEHDQVGRWYADHLAAFGGVVASPLDPTTLDLVHISGVAHPASDGAPVAVMGMPRLSDAALRREGLPGLRLELFVTDPTNSPRWASGIGLTDVSELLGATKPASPTRSLLGFSAYLEPVADPESRVELSSRTDAFGRPLAKLTWRHGTADQQHLQRGLALMGAALGAGGAGRLVFVGPWLSADPEAVGDGGLSQIVVTPSGAIAEPVAFGTTYHHMCTTRMDPDPTRGVVDPDCRVHGLRNLWVAGSSVFPTPSGMFPTMTIVALALRLAEHLHHEVLT